MENDILLRVKIFKPDKTILPRNVYEALSGGVKEMFLADKEFLLRLLEVIYSDFLA